MPREAIHPDPPPAPKRRIVQITAAKGVDEYPDVFAVCDDGTAWALMGNRQHWEPLPEIPQDE